MKNLFLIFALFSSALNQTATAERAETLHPHIVIDGALVAAEGKAWLNASDAVLGADTPPPETYEEKAWKDAVCRSQNLLRAMTLNENESRQYLQWPYVESPWVGDQTAALAKWGWADRAEHWDQQYCDFNNRDLTRTFNDLGIDMRSAENGGTSHCFCPRHQDGPTVRKIGGKVPSLERQRYDVDGKLYRVRWQIYPNTTLNQTSDVYLEHRRIGTHRHQRQGRHHTLAGRQIARARRHGQLGSRQCPTRRAAEITRPLGPNVGHVGKGGAGRS
jgi:hypothetical protein